MSLDSPSLTFRLFEQALSFVGEILLCSGLNVLQLIESDGQLTVEKSSD